MSIYFSSQQVSVSFKRLASRKTEGKTPLERTSVLMYFLAFDAVCQNTQLTRLDLNPDTTEGKTNRKSMELEFAKLVLLDRSHGQIRQVSQLGKVDSDSKDPQKRISSNFLTVPLKKASEQRESYFYPKRPSTPLFKMGASATGLKWGVEYYEDWAENLPKLLSEVKESTPFTDLAIFVMRDCAIDDRSKNTMEVFKSLIPKRFTKVLANFWLYRIEKEKVLAKHIGSPFSQTHEPFGKTQTPQRADGIESAEKSTLVKYINYLEGVLISNQITFKHFKK